VGLHPDERHLDHGRTDLPRVRPLLLGPASGRERRHLGIARRRVRADPGDARDRGPPAPRPRAVPRARGVRAIRLRPRQDDAGAAQPRAPARRDPQAEPVCPDERRAPDRLCLRRHEGLPRRPPRRGRPAVRDRPPRVPGKPERPAPPGDPGSRQTHAGDRDGALRGGGRGEEGLPLLPTRGEAGLGRRQGQDMANLIDIRRRIRSVKNTQQITKAVKMVAASKLRRSQDRGLAGGFNTNVNRAVTTFLREAEGRGVASVRLVTLGKKANDFWRRRPVEILEARMGLAGLGVAPTAEIGRSLAARFVSGEADAVYVVSNEFRSAISQVVRTKRLLPIALESATAAPADPDYLYEPSPGEILGILLPRFLAFQMYRVVLESQAAFFAAQMTAMDSASKNAGDMIDSLTLIYNRARQARITKELIEIVSGAAALE